MLQNEIPQAPKAATDSPFFVTMMELSTYQCEQGRC